MHVDEFIYNSSGNEYPRFVLMLFRLPAKLRMDWDAYIKQVKLFCTYKDTRFRVTGASRLGWVLLSKNFDEEVTYEETASIEDCSRWAPEP